LQYSALRGRLTELLLELVERDVRTREASDVGANNEALPAVSPSQLVEGPGDEAASSPRTAQGGDARRQLEQRQSLDTEATRAVCRRDDRKTSTIDPAVEGCDADAEEPGCNALRNRRPELPAQGDFDVSQIGAEPGIAGALDREPEADDRFEERSVRHAAILTV
jgi:hypothetical protein